jgi:hypothetical protein
VATGGAAFVGAEEEEEEEVEEGVEAVEEDGEEETVSFPPAPLWQLDSSLGKDAATKLNLIGQKK